MDMTDNEQLLETFFQPARNVELPDNGFTHRVMRQVPHSNVKLKSRLWTAFCLAVATCLFVLADAWSLVVERLQALLTHPPTQHQLLMLMVSLGVIGVLVIAEVFQRERISWPFSSNMP